MEVEISVEILEAHLMLKEAFSKKLGKTPQKSLPNVSHVSKQLKMADALFQTFIIKHGLPLN